MITYSSYAFGLQFILGLSIASALYLWYAFQHDHTNWRKWLDVSLISALLALIAGRIGNIFIEWEYFSTYSEDVFDLWYAGFQWHTMLLVALLSLWFFCRIYRINFGDVSDAFALTLPLLMLSAWWGCRSGGCAYGKTVASDEYPSWTTGFLPDTFGSVELRLEVQVFAALLALFIFWLAIWLKWQQSYSHRRIWIVMSAIGLAMFIVGFWRGDDVVSRFGLRIDQWLDLAVIAFALIGFWRIRPMHSLQTNTNYSG